MTETTHCLDCGATNRLNPHGQCRNCGSRNWAAKINLAEALHPASQDAFN